MNDALTIAVVCYPSLGGSGIVAAELAVRMAQRGHRVHMIGSSVPSRPLPACSRLSFHEVRPPSYPLFDPAPYTLALASTLARVVKEHAVELVHVHYAVPHAVSAYLARQTLRERAPRLVTTLHGTDVTHIGLDAYYRDVTRFCVEASDAITVPSSFLQREAHRLLGVEAGREIDVIPNFVDTEHFTPPARRDPARFAELFAQGDAGSTAPVLFHVSNFRPVKRVTDLLEVLSRVRQQVAARLVLVGDGPDRAAAAQRARELGVEQSVCFLGKRPDFVDYLRHADAFLLTSESESFGLAALEALSCGVPVLGYQVGGVASVVSDEVGRLVQPFDVGALAKAAVDVLANVETRRALGAAARLRAVTHFRAGPACDRYEELFRRVLAQRSAGRA